MSKVWMLATSVTLAPLAHIHQLEALTRALNAFSAQKADTPQKENYSARGVRQGHISLRKASPRASSVRQGLQQFRQNKSASCVRKEASQVNQVYAKHTPRHIRIMFAWYAFTVGQEACKQCAPGKISTGTGSTSCILCKIGSTA